MIHLIYIYFILNTFFTGHFIGANGEDLNITMIILGSLALLLFGIPIIIITTLFDFIIIPLWELSNIYFFFQFYFTSKWKNKDEEFMKDLNDFARHWNSNSLKNRMKKFTLNMVNKRNNYNPDLLK